MSTKRNILAFLESNREQSISGEHIAGRLSVSRNAVWKAIEELRKDGYKIDAVPNRGYRLLEDNDILSSEGMLPFLERKEVAGRIAVHASLESTNKTAKQLAMSGAEHGTAIVADSQTAGRGRYGRGFYSPPGHGVYMSFILRPERMGFEAPTLVTAFAAVAVCEAVEAVAGKSPQIKWVNDVFLDGKKICGILTEAISDFESGNIEWIVVGVGVNFSAPDEGFPKELKDIAGAVFPQGNPPVTRNRLAAEIVNRITAQRQYGREELLERYKSRLMMLGKRISASSERVGFEAVAVDIDDMGRLIVRMDDGETLALSSGEISVRA